MPAAIPLRYRQIPLFFYNFCMTKNLIKLIFCIFILQWPVFGEGDDLTDITQLSETYSQLSAEDNDDKTSENSTAKDAAIDTNFALP